MRYCGNCPPSDEVVAWTEGRSHRYPLFGDDNQRRVATAKRQVTFTRMKIENPKAALAFPEFYEPHERAQYTEQFAKQMCANFDRVIRRLPGFAAYARVRPHVVNANDYGKHRRKARTRTRKQWQLRMIRGYLQEQGFAGMQLMHLVIGRRMPWWARARLEPMEELFLAA